MNEKGTLRSKGKVSNCFSIAPFLGKIIPTEKVRSEIVSVGTVLFWGRRFCRERCFFKMANSSGKRKLSGDRFFFVPGSVRTMKVNMKHLPSVSLS